MEVLNPKIIWRNLKVNYARVRKKVYLNNLMRLKIMFSSYRMTKSLTIHEKDVLMKAMKEDL